MGASYYPYGDNNTRPNYETTVFPPYYRNTKDGELHNIEQALFRIEHLLREIKNDK